MDSIARRIMWIVLDAETNGVLMYGIRNSLYKAGYWLHFDCARDVSDKGFVSFSKRLIIQKGIKANAKKL